MNSKGHRNVVDYRERNEKGYVPDRGRSSWGTASLFQQHGQETQTATEVPRPGKRGNADYQDWFDECGCRDDHDRPVNPHMILPSLSYHIGLTLVEKDPRTQRSYAKGAHLTEHPESTNIVVPDQIVTARTTTKNPLMIHAWICTVP